MTAGKERAAELRNMVPKKIRMEENRAEVISKTHLTLFQKRTRIPRISLDFTRKSLFAIPNQKKNKKQSVPLYSFSQSLLKRNSDPF